MITTYSLFDILDNHNLGMWEYSLNFLFPTKWEYVVKVNFPIIP